MVLHSDVSRKQWFPTDTEHLHDIFTALHTYVELEPLPQGSFNHIVWKILLKKVRRTGFILPRQICYFERVTTLIFNNFWRNYIVCAANRIPHFVTTLPLLVLKKNWIQLTSERWI
jgi:hypothetical protein